MRPAGYVVIPHLTLGHGRRKDFFRAIFVGRIFSGKFQNPGRGLALLPMLMPLQQLSLRPLG